MGNMPPPSGMIFPPGMHPLPAAGGAGGTAAEEIWVENTTPEGKVLTPDQRLYTISSDYVGFFWVWAVIIGTGFYYNVDVICIYSIY